jgi:hypothetical protein
LHFTFHRFGHANIRAKQNGESGGKEEGLDGVQGLGQGEIGQEDDEGGAATCEAKSNDGLLRPQIQKQQTHCEKRLIWLWYHNGMSATGYFCKKCLQNERLSDAENHIGCPGDSDEEDW